MSYFYTFNQYDSFTPMPYFYNQPLENYYYFPNEEALNFENVVIQQNQHPNIMVQQNVNQLQNEGSEERSQKRTRPRPQRRGIDKEKELQSAKKNSESNIINQFFSFFSSKIQSEQIVQKAILVSVSHTEDKQKIISIFYNIIKCMSVKRIKKYVNKSTLLNIFYRTNIETEIPEIVEKFKMISFLTIEQICQVIRRCCFYFIKETSLVSILSSKRISTASKSIHLKKRRILSNAVCGKA